MQPFCFAFTQARRYSLLANETPLNEQLTLRDRERNLDVIEP
jgi:hypothetical protein